MLHLISLLAGLRRWCACGAAMVFAIVAVSAATLPFDAPLHIQPDDNSPVVGTLPSDTSIKPMVREDLSAVGLNQPPSGWIAMRGSGPFTGFVRNRDVVDNGSIRIGAEIRAQPLADAPLLLIVEEGDRTEASEPLGDWSRATIHTELIVFVNSLPPESRSQAAAFEPDDAAPTSPSVVAETAPADPKPAKARKPKREKRQKEPRAPKVEPTPAETTGAPRTFEGYLLRTRRFLGRGPKYDYQLVDEANDRIALLDLSQLSSAAQLDALENRRVSVYGPGISREDVKDLIIRVETLRLLQ